ncbi:MAG: hypothetical protein M1269_10510 [Chloroflexi bacterium]|nr:hypothetical protein [Chloroflexota bacterium]
MDRRFKISVDVFRIPHRRCRIFQEQISDFYQDGRPRFQWEVIRQNWMLSRNNTILEICGDCRLNLTETVEGCSTTIDYLDSYLAAVAVARPDSILLSLLQNNVYEYDALEVFVKELKSVTDDLENITWYGAQLFAFALPVPDENGKPLIYPWDGDPHGYYFFSNAAYSTGVSTEGILLRELRGGQPSVFTSLLRHGPQILGMDRQGSMHNLVPDGGIMPAWESPSHEISELRHVKMSALEIFRHIHETLILFAGTASKEQTAFMVEEVY